MALNSNLSFDTQNPGLTVKHYIAVCKLNYNLPFETMLIQ